MLLDSILIVILNSMTAARTIQERLEGTFLYGLIIVLCSCIAVTSAQCSKPRAGSVSCLMNSAVRTIVNTLHLTKLHVNDQQNSVTGT